MPLAPGDRLGPYEIVAPLGAGGMGAVYRARDSKLHRDVALKVLPDGFAADAERVSRFQREARTLAALNHPQIAAIYGLEESTGTPALVMELVEGEDLAQRISRGAIPLADALRIAVQIADALDGAHERGIVHRDLKPANIKLRGDGSVKVLDFGLAKMFAAGDPADSGHPEPNLANSPTITSPLSITTAGMLLGTAAYMSPEQARGQTVDARTDLWAFGCVLFEMLTGTRTFGGDTVTDLLAAVVKEEPRWETLPGETPPAIHRLLRRCLTKDRKRRLASAADAVLDIEEALGGGGFDQKAATPRARNQSPVSLALAAAAVLGAIIGAYLLGSRTTMAPALPATSTRFLITAPAGTQIVSGHREVAVSADGQQVAFIARGAAGQHIYLRRLDEVLPRQIAGTEGARDVTFSPDGRWLAFNAASKIRKVSLAGGVPATLADALHSHGLAWHAAEDAIYFAPNQLSSIWKVSANGDAPAAAVTTLDATRGEYSHEYPLFSADGRTMIFTTNANTADLTEPMAAIRSLATGARHTVRTGGNAFALTDRGELLFVRRGSAMAARYADGRLAPSELVEGASAVTGAISSTVALATASTFVFVPSPDSTRRSLVWISPDGRQSDAGFGRRDYGGLSLSPDGRRAAISVGDGSDAALYLADAKGGALTLLTKPAAWTPAWSPDGKWIAGSVELPNTSGLRLARVAAEAGRAWEELYNSETTSEAVAQWTPDGRSLFFSAHEALTGRRSIARVVLDGSRAAPSVVVDGTGQHIVQFPAISPDGRWLAYESNESGRAEVYVQSYPSPDTRVQVSQEGGTRPTWARDGTALYVVTGAAIVSRTVTSQPELRFGTPRTVVNDPLLVLQPGASWKSFDIAPDGRFLVIKEDDSVRSDHIVVVQNWHK